MNEQFDLQAFLLKLPDYTTGNDRNRLYNILQQNITCELTLAATLNILQSLFDQNQISEEDFDILIQTFRGIKSYDAVKRLQEHKSVSSKVINNDKKVHKTKTGFLASNEHNTSKVSSTERSHQSQSLLNKICQLKLTKYDIILIVLNISIIVAFVIIFINHKGLSLSKKQNDGITVIKVGILHGQPEGGHGPFFDAAKAGLYFTDRIIRVDGTEDYDAKGNTLLRCIQFTYSNHKAGNKFGCMGYNGTRKTEPLKLTDGEHIKKVITYIDDRKIENTWKKNASNIIVGIRFLTDGNQDRWFGSENGTEQEEEYKDFVVGFVRGKSGGHIDSLRFIWYKYSSKDSPVF